MTELARVAVALVADTEGFRRDMLRASQQFNAVGQQMRRAGAELSRKVTAPLVAIGVAALKMASDAEEAANKFDVVMGGAADEVRARFRDLHETIPLTTSQMESAAASIQNMLVPMGIARERAAGMSGDFVELAGDLASFNNVGTDQVLMAVVAALKGSSEPMRQFGVDTRVTRLEQIALAEGIIDTGEKLDNTTTALAVMAAIMADSTDAMGDAERTAGSFANQVRFLYRDVRELAIAIGQQLMPIVLPMVQRARELVEVFAAMSPETQRFIVTAGLMAAALGPVLLVVGQLTMALTGMGAVLAVHPVGAFITLLVGGLATWTAWHEATKNSTEALREHKASVDAARASVSELTLAQAAQAKATVDAAIAQKEAILETLRARLSTLEAERRAADPSEWRAYGEQIDDTRDAVVLHSQSLERLKAVSEGATERIQSLSQAEMDLVGNVEAVGVAVSGTIDTLDDMARALDLVEDLQEDIAAAEFALKWEKDAEAIAELNTELEENQRLLRDVTDAVKAYVDQWLRMNEIDFSGAQIPGQGDGPIHMRRGGLTTSTPTPDLSGMEEWEEHVRKVFGALNDEIQRLRDQEAVIYQVADLAHSLGLLSDRANGAVNAIGSIVRGMEALKTAQALRSLQMPGAGLATISGVAGIATGVIGVVSSLFGASKEAQEAARRMEEARQKFSKSLDDLVFSLEFQGNALERGMVDLIGKWQRQIDDFNELFGGGITLPRTGDPEEFLQNLPAGQPWWSDEMLAAWEKIVRGLEADMEALAEKNAEMAASMREEFEIRALIAQGMDEEAAKRRREIQMREDVQRAIDLGDQALADFIVTVYEMEQAAIDAAKAAEEAAQKADFETELERLKIQNSGDDEALFRFDLAREMEEMRAYAQGLFDDGIIDQTQLDQWLAEVARFGEIAIRDYADAIREAEEAAKAAAAAERFRQMVDEENLRIRIMLARGENEAARAARNQLELIEAINDGRSAEYIRLLQIAHAEEERAAALDESRQALEETTRAINGVSNVLNGPAGFPFALLRARAALQQGMPAMPGVTGPDRGGSRFQPGQTVNNQQVVQNFDVSGLTITYTGRESERELAQKVTRAIVREMKAGGVNPIATNSAA